MRNLVRYSLTAPCLGRSILLGLVVLCGFNGDYVAANEKPVVGGPAGTTEFVYYLWDNGDGRIIPTALGQGNVPAQVSLVWEKPGDYRTSWQAIGVSGQRHASGEKNVRVRRPRELPPLQWEGEANRKAKADFLDVNLPEISSVDWVVLTSKRGKPFPAHFRLLYQLELQGNWFGIGSAVVSWFPHPEKKEVWIPLHGLAVRNLRIQAEALQVDADWEVGNVRVYGHSELPWRLGKTDEQNAIWWNMWLNFGEAKNQVHQRFDPWWETDRPLDGGMACIGSAEWFYWGSKKFSWRGPDPQARRLENKIVANPVSENGLVWAAPNSPMHLGHSIHYVNNAIYPMAVANHYLLQRNEKFLKKKDPKSDKTVLEKARQAMRYQLDRLQGKDGLVVYSDKENDGTSHSLGSNYWDLWHFGYQSAYANALFYESLLKFAELEEVLGEAETAEEYRQLADKVKQRYNELFWDEEKGRYLGWIDADGKRHDYGFTFVNVKALALGLASEEQGQRVLSWLEGERIVKGEASTGDDIYHFGLAVRSNTVDARFAPGAVNTWNGAIDLSPGGSGGYGRQIQNGGAIFYVSFYDLLARQRYGGMPAVKKLTDRIEREFKKDQLMRDPANNTGQSDILGVLREFPESGLVPYFVIEGYLGLQPNAQGVLFRPSLPEGSEKMEVEEVWLFGKRYAVTIDAANKEPVRKEEAHLILPADGVWQFKLDETWEAAE